MEIAGGATTIATSSSARTVGEAANLSRVLAGCMRSPQKS
jgi:hypothetical protein